MIGYMMKNSEGEYLAMDGGTTTDWFKASKFNESGIEARRVYLECGYELYTFEVKEKKCTTCKNKCHKKLEVKMNNDGLFIVCSGCGDNIYDSNSGVLMANRELD